jgi:hypothetical protein
MATTIRKPISIARLGVVVVALAFVIRDLLAHPELVPPTILGLSLGLAGALAGALFASVAIAWRWVRQTGPYARRAHARIPHGGIRA